MKTNYSKFSYLLIALIIIFIGYGQFKSILFERELKKNGKITIGKIDSIQTNPKRTYIYLTYIIGDDKITSFESGLNKKITKKDIGNYYEIRYLDESPEIIRTDFSKKITDTTLILKAGFSKEDIANMPK